ncbi:POTRA domain-containing protein, partial [Rhizobium leguminosarum]|uniref:POTRA domain-containing protein n=1 Tax=Rhizobium leguminosarum TaxID=384 RepID=UPI003F97E64C
SSLLEIFDSKKLVDDEYRKDLQNLITRYHKAGYRDAEILSDSIVPRQDGSRKSDIYINIHEGQKYYIKDIRFIGNTKYNSEALRQ